MRVENSTALQQFGITLKESKRYNTVGQLFGPRLAEIELQKNLKSYEKEFLKDEAVSDPHTYYLLHNQLFSQNNEHALFNIKNQINPQEREGETLFGFRRYEKQIADAPIDTIHLWYSPDGPSGLENINFDAGRLYICMKTGEDTSVHFDLKVRPEFPILPFLGTLHEQRFGYRPRFDSPEVGKRYYLTQPLQSQTNIDDFFSFIENYAQNERQPLYISQRNSSHPTTRTFSSAVEEMKTLFVQYLQSTNIIVEPVGDKTTTAMMDEEELMRRYVAVIQPYVEKNNGSITLYGCSTTSTVTSNDIQGLISQHSVGELISLYSTQRRLLTNKPPSVFDAQKDQYDDYKCPHCETTLQGELKGKPETWKKECPHCHGQLHCAN